MKKRHSAEQIVAKLRQADIELGKGMKVPEVCRQLGISEQTYYRWRTKYGGISLYNWRAAQSAVKPCFLVENRSFTPFTPSNRALSQQFHQHRVFLIV
jgi:transposase